MDSNYIKPAYIKHRISNVITITKIVTVHYFEFKKDFDIHFESHDFWEIVYIDSGKAISEGKNKSNTLSQGDVIFIKPNEKHKLRGDGVNNFNAFIISFTSNSECMSFFKNKIIKVPQNLKRYISLIFNEGNNAFVLPKNNPYLVELKLRHEAPVGSAQMVRSYLEQFIILLLRNEEKKFDLTDISDNSENRVAVLVKNILVENIYGSITVEELCTHLHYSRMYLSKIFKKYSGSTINQYYNELKIKEAKKLIRSGDYNFTQISEMLGFDNSHYFSRVFRRISNMTPTEYLNSSNM